MTSNIEYVEGKKKNHETMPSNGAPTNKNYIQPH